MSQLQTPKLQSNGWQTSSGKGQRVNMLGFVVYTDWHKITKAAQAVHKWMGMSLPQYNYFTKNGWGATFSVNWCKLWPTAAGERPPCARGPCESCHTVLWSRAASAPAGPGGWAARWERQGGPPWEALTAWRLPGRARQPRAGAGSPRPRAGSHRLWTSSCFPPGSPQTLFPTLLSASNTTIDNPSHLLHQFDGTFVSPSPGPSQGT